MSSYAVLIFWYMLLINYIKKQMHKLFCKSSRVSGCHPRFLVRSFRIRDTQAAVHTCFSIFFFLLYSFSFHPLILYLFVCFTKRLFLPKLPTTDTHTESIYTKLQRRTTPPTQSITTPSISYVALLYTAS